MSNKKGKYYFDVTIFADIFISFLFWSVSMLCMCVCVCAFSVSVGFYSVGLLHSKFLPVVR